MFLSRAVSNWILFGTCLAVLLAGTGYITVVAVWLDRKDAADQRAAEFEENVRLALWRIDSALTPLIALEAARPPAHFTTYYAVAGSINQAHLAIQDGQVLAPSPLVAFRSPYVQLHFQYEPGGTISSPQAPSGDMLESLRARYGDVVRMEQASRTLERLRSMLDFDLLVAALPPLGEDPSLAIEASVPFLLCCPSMTLADSGSPTDISNPASQPGLVRETGRARNDPTQQWIRSSIEQTQRVKQSELSNQLVGDSSATIPLQNRGAMHHHAALAAVQVPSWNNMKLGGSRMIWNGEELFLMRRVAAAGTEYVQGCWFDWPEMRQWFLEQIGDLLPEAALVPVGDWSAAEASGQTRLLGAAPVGLVPGRLPADQTPLASPTRHSLVIAWCCVLLAVASAIILLKGTIALSDRRAQFVSAVTHELRTPLTTFRMYAEMLAAGMISEERKRGEYLDTLRHEADRLGHLVENVLSYARLDHGRSQGGIEEITVGTLLDRLSDRLRQRSEHAARTLSVEQNAATRELTVRTDVTAVGQILFNLVDNACKYGGSKESSIHVQAAACNGVLEIRVRDDGPGISESVARRLFRPFSKSAEAAAQTAPGIGLGLALSRRLARSLGGDLLLESNNDRGCCFVLSLPR